MAGFLSPVREVGPRPDPDTQKEQFWYVRSFLLMRVAIGVLGVVLPLWLVFADKVAFHGDPFPRGSLSAYYYSGMRDVFVGIMSATGVFLITYKLSERNLDNAMALAVLWLVVTLSVGWPARALLIGEWVSAWAFGASWLAKGAELDTLFGRTRRPIEAASAS